VTVRDVDVEYAFDDPDEGWFGMARPVDAAPARHGVDLLPDEDVRAEARDDDSDNSADTDRWLVADVERAVADAPPPARTERARADERPAAESVADSIAALTASPTKRKGFVSAPVATSWESRLSNSGAWDFKASSGSTWNRSKVLVIVGLVIAAVAVVVGIVYLVRSPSPAADESTRVAPSASLAPTSAPALSTQAPVPAPPPPGPPPPPAPSAEELSPPVNRQYTPRYQAPRETSKPEINVTRAPLSATPPPPPKPDRNSSTPGDGRKRGGFGW
jgi:hypothetical protein